MFKPLMLFVAVVLFEIVIVPSSAREPQETAPTASNAARPSPQALDKAKAVYKIDCALCHGANGDGKTQIATDMSLTLDDWTDPKSLAGKSDKDLFDIIRNGKDKMPAEPSGRATDAEVRTLIYYIRSMAKVQPASPATPAPPSGASGSTAPNK